jgi:hypothetical protein
LAIQQGTAYVRVSESKTIGSIKVIKQPRRILEGKSYTGLFAGTSDCQQIEITVGLLPLFQFQSSDMHHKPNILSQIGTQGPTQHSRSYTKLKDLLASKC